MFARITVAMLRLSHAQRRTTMSQFIHCCILLYIVFVIAEIRNVLVYSDPQQAAPLTIWEETQHSLTDEGHKNIYKF